MIRKIAFTAAVLLGFCTANVSAQKAEISFSETSYDFGQIEEGGGNVSHVFEFTNTGSTPLVIQRVNASCGCTTPEWTKTPIEPGKRGNVTATYNPLGRPGAFNKQVYVYSNSSNEMVNLTIKGNVTPKSSSGNTVSHANNYPIQIEDLRLNSKVVQMSNVDKKSTQTRTVGIMNASASNLTVTLADVPAYLGVNVTPKTLKPNEQGSITFTFDGAKATEWGPVDDKVSLVLNGKKITVDANRINVQANVMEDFSKSTAEQKRLSPIIEVKSYNLFIGNIKKGNRVRGKVTIKNAGNNPLEIRRIINNNSDIVIHPMRLTIKGGHTENFKIDVDSKFLPKGDYKKAFTVQSYDPVNTYVTFTVTYKVI